MPIAVNRQNTQTNSTLKEVLALAQVGCS